MWSDRKKVTIDGVEYVLRPKYKDIDDSQLSFVDRLGLAYCRLNSYEWDPILGEEPPSASNSFYYRKMNAIKDLIGDENASRCWWLFELRKTEEEWRAWYYRVASPEPTADDINRTRQSSDSEEGRREKLKYLPSFIRSLFFKE